MVDPCPVSFEQHERCEPYLMPALYYTRGDVTLSPGDCIAFMEAMPEKSVDLVIADLPYNLSNGGFTCQSGRRAPVYTGACDPFRKPGRQMRKVGSIPSRSGAEKKYGRHPTQKTYALLEHIILGCTGQGSLVPDPFTGSSTTRLAADATGRWCVGIDREPEYPDRSIARFEDRGRGQAGSMVGGARDA